MVTARDKSCFAIGCAGWSIRGEHATLFPGEDSHLARYARRLHAVELNSSFYRPHRRSTYERWAASVPENFKFAVKAPKEITHDLRFMNAVVPLELFLEQISGLGDRLGPILLQLPPTMEYCRAISGRFFEVLRGRFDGAVVLEPRHVSWFSDAAERQLESFRIARAAVDPCVAPSAAEPGGWKNLAYYRLHGSPLMYESAYGAERLEGIARRLCDCARSAATWCVFDNTKYGAAALDALALCDEHVPRALEAVEMSSAAVRSAGRGG
ncbi:MAG TPA: DUF72 domain-containing protein [Candidatus Limnocylindrales bacterium]|nr:DUF72 domain-containing protein [Candidatus Limnocylindrales bacterium]